MATRSLWSDGAVDVGAVVARCHALGATVVGRAWESGTTVVRVVGLFVRWSGLGVLLAVKSGSSAAKQGRSSRAKADCKCSHLMLSALALPILPSVAAEEPDSTVCSP